MDNLNRRFNQTNNAMIGFYMKCDPTYVNNSTHVTKTFTGASLLMAANNDEGSINVHIIGSFADANTAGFSIPQLNASMVPSGSYLFGRANGDLAHEIGHVLGLTHTHQYSAWNWKCLTECVSRTRTWPIYNLCPTKTIFGRVCETTGDGLRDTQADDNLVRNNACFYNVNFGDDEWGDSYDNPPAGLQDRPNINNIMSYNSATNCVDQFSRLQIGVMLYTLYFRKPFNLGGWANPISTFDDFEPDNEPIIAREILLNQVQERNFHRQWNRIGSYGYTTSCDIDWVRFVAPCSSTFDVQTFENPVRTNADTRLTLFDAALNQLAQNDDISPSNQFSRVSFNFIAGQTYFIRIENLSANVTGYYNLSVGFGNYAIAGDNNFCTTSNNYTIPDLPAGATVHWEVTPAGIATPNSPDLTQTTLTRNDGIITLTATISNICGGPIIIRKENIIVGAAGISITSSSNVCNGTYQSWYLNANPSSNGSNWQWTVDYLSPGSDIYIDNPNSPFTYADVSGGGVVRLTYTDLCGGTRTDGVTIYSNCQNGFAYTIAPNPASSTVTVFEKEPAPGKEKPGKTITELNIYDKQGNLKKHQKYDKVKKATLDVSNLKPDIYIIEIVDGNYKERQQLSVIK